MKFYSSFSITPENCLINRAINYGDGLFETMLIVDGQIPLWDLHFQRLDESLGRLNMQSPDQSCLHGKILALVNDGCRYIAKLVVFRDDFKRGYASQSSNVQFYITINPYNKSSANDSSINDSLAVSSVRLSQQKQLAGLKHLNRLEQVLAANELDGRELSDAIMLDGKQRVIETISKNIVMIKNNRLYTPKLNKCGVYGVALRWLEAQGFELKWKKIEFSTLQKYDGMMVCNSVQGFSTIGNIEHKITFQQRLSVVDSIQQKWNARIKTQ
ncbi:MAG: aminodeoxychorismate lyase [Proteobacteria bacterium]|nr:aminodeoxychorismate lyase [Pseudomonadota bacterium]